MCSGSEAGPYLRLVDFVYHSTLGLKVMKRDKERLVFYVPSSLDSGLATSHVRDPSGSFFFFYITIKPRVE